MSIDNGGELRKYVDEIKSADIKEVAQQIEQNKQNIKYHEQQRVLAEEKLEISKEAMELHIKSYRDKYLNAPEAAAEGPEQSEGEIIAPPVQDSGPAEGGGAHEVGEDSEAGESEY